MNPVAGPSVNQGNRTAKEVAMNRAGLDPSRIPLLVGWALLVLGLILGRGHAQPNPRTQGPQAQRPLPPEIELLPDVVFGKGGGRDLKMNILRPRVIPDAPMPVVVWVHGGAWMSGNNNPGQNVQLARKGYFTASIEYRLSDEAKFPAQIEDCKAAIRYLRANAEKYHINPERIGCWGSSAGGHLVALLGTSGGVEELEGNGGNPGYSSRVQCVVDLFGPTDFLEIGKFPSNLRHFAADSPESRLIGGPVLENPEKCKAANPITYVDKDDPPFLILHGDKDMTVPFNQSELLYAALQRAGVEATFVPVKGGGHGWGPQDKTEPSAQEINAMILAFFDKHLKDAPQ